MERKRGLIKPASDGETYLSMVTRGNAGPNANTVEDVQTEFIKPLPKQKAYQFRIDLSFSPVMKYQNIWTGVEFKYDTPAVIKVWLSNTGCERQQLIWQSPVIDHTQWKTYTFTTKSFSQTFQYFIMQVDYAQKSYTFGNMLVDNLRMAVLYKIYLPNAFTPNGDGINDQFHPVTELKLQNFTLKIYDRWGKKYLKLITKLKAGMASIMGKLLTKAHIYGLFLITELQEKDFNARGLFF